MKKPTIPKGCLGRLTATVLLGLAVGAGSAQALPVITQVVETSDGSDTSPAAQYTGVTWDHPNEGNNFTVPVFGEDVPAYTDRTHEWNGATPSLPLPGYLVGGEYIMSGNNKRDDIGYALDITISEESWVYVLVDNRLGGTSNSTPPPVDTEMDWLGQLGWVPMSTGHNRAGDAALPDEVGVDESGDGVGPGVAINQWSSVYVRRVPAGTFFTADANNPGRNMYGVVVKPVSADPEMLTFAGSATRVQFKLRDGSANAVNPAEVSLTVDGAEAAVTSSKQGEITTFIHTPATPFAANSTHTATISIGGQTTDVSFTIGSYLEIPAEFAVNPGEVNKSAPGFTVQSYGTDEDNPGTVDWAEEQLRGEHGENLVFPTDPQPEPSVINYGINDVPIGNFQDATMTDPILTDRWIPGLPGLQLRDNGTGNAALEVTTWIEFPEAGLYDMGVNSDDGFRLTTGVNPRSLSSVVVAEHPGTRGAGDTIGTILITEAGIYPFRLVYFNAGGGAGLEFFASHNGVRALVNDPNTPGALKAYAEGPAGPAWLKSVSPGVNAGGVATDASLEAVFEDGTTTVDPGTVQMTLNGEAVDASTSKSGSTTTATFTPAGGFDSGATYTASVTATDSAGTDIALTWTFTIIRKPLDKPPYQQTDDGMVVIEAEDFHALTPRGNHNWEFKTEVPDYSGDGYMQALPDGVGGTTSHYPGFLDQNPQLDYRVQFVKTGTHYMWFRGQATGGKDDSVHAGIDGDSPPTGQRIDGDGGYNPRNTWVWVRASHNDGRAAVEVPSADEHVINVWQREDGFKFDKLILTTDVDYTPTGQGPPPSRFVGEAPPPSVAITAPANLAKLPAGDVTVTATASDANGTIAKVEFFADGNLIGEATAEPFSITWSNPPAGRYVLTARATDNDDDFGDAAPIKVQVGTPAPQALFVVSDAANLNPSDTGVRDRLAAFGFDVTVVSAAASTTGDAAFAELIVISSTVNSGAVGTKFTAVPVPIVQWEQALQDELIMTQNDGAFRGNAADQTDIIITDATHEMAAGLSAGTHTIASSPTGFTWGIPDQGNPTIVATLADGSGNPCIYGFDTGAIMVDGVTAAPARRVTVPMSNDSYAVFNDTGKMLIDAALSWAVGRPLEVQTEVVFDPPVLNGATLTISWTGSGTLQESTDLTTWTDVTPQPTGNTVDVDVSGAPMKFYRVAQ